MIYGTKGILLIAQGSQLEARSSYYVTNLNLVLHIVAKHSAIPAGISTLLAMLMFMFLAFVCTVITNLGA